MFNTYGMVSWLFFLLFRLLKENYKPRPVATQKPFFLLNNFTQFIIFVLSLTVI